MKIKTQQLKPMGFSKTVLRGMLIAIQLTSRNKRKIK